MSAMPHLTHLPPKTACRPPSARHQFEVEPWPDGRRIRVLVSLTPFLERPNLYASIQNAKGDEVSSAVIVETMDDQMVFTMHIRAEEVGGVYTLTLSITYPDHEEVDAAPSIYVINSAYASPPVIRSGLGCHAVPVNLKFGLFLESEHL
jgi:hypothetical protein